MGRLQQEQESWGGGEEGEVRFEMSDRPWIYKPGVQERGLQWREVFGSSHPRHI